ncbi:MAG TPA: ABC transporter transmembrane domain-containing protein [Mycobacteriales bacterium]|nr:ABC transporter transmembrane domain-containing protein [Mycobacteriales bacterium]
MSAARHGTGNLATLREAAGWWRRQPAPAAVALVAVAIQQAFLIGFAFSLKILVADITKHKPQADLAALLVVLGAGFVLAAAATVVGERAVARLAARLTNDLRREVYQHVLRLAPAYLLTNPSAKITKKFTSDLRNVEGGYVQAFVDTYTLVVETAIAVPLLVILDWRLALITCLTLPLVGFAADRLLPRLMAASDEQSASELALLAALQDTVRAQEVVRIFHLEPELSERFDGLLDTHHEKAVRVRGVGAVSGKGAGLAVLLVQVIVTVVGAELAAHQRLPIESLVGFTTILALLAKSCYDFVKTDLPLLAEAGRGRQGLAEFLAAPVVVADPPAAPSLPPLRGSIELDDASFRYPGSSRKAIDHVSLTIRPGTNVAVVGTNGSGKSTLLRLLMRYYDPEHGTVSIDGIALRDVTQRSVREQMGVVLQGNYLFNDTVRENIRIGRPGASDAEVEAGARRAELHEAVLAMTDGYDTVVGEAGGRLSGGLQQRLAIARAMIRDPRILLLDEVTTALDPVTEAAIHEMLAHAGAGRTVVAATHRLAAARTADEIVVMEAGRIVERGRHDELLAAGGAYARLWEKQSGFAVSADGRQATVDAGRLRHVNLFADLDDSTLSRIAEGLTSEYYEADQVVFREGDPGDRFYLIARGRVAVETATSEGDLHLYETLGDGDHFGEVALLQDRARTATIRTIAPSVFLTMDRPSFIRLVETTPEMGRALEERMTRTEINLGEWRRLVGPG